MIFLAVTRDIFCSFMNYDEWCNGLNLLSLNMESESRKFSGVVVWSASKTNEVWKMFELSMHYLIHVVLLYLVFCGESSTT